MARRVLCYALGAAWGTSPAPGRLEAAGWDGAAVLLVDAFPGGVLGEVCGLAAPDGLERHHTARLLRWGVYRNLGRISSFSTVKNASWRSPICCT